jgi:hypothetical protein
MKGFTLFFAMLAASLALSIGLAIFDITLRELELSSTVAQSEYAIYAADSGAECALYWDAKYNGAGTAFATSSQSSPPTSGILCNNLDIAAAAVAAHTWPLSTNGSAATTTFTLTFSPQPYCATVTVAKSGNPSATDITSDGFNTCSGGGLQVERVLYVNY